MEDLGHDDAILKRGTDTILQPATHPLQPLTAQEIRAAIAIIQTTFERMGAPEEVANVMMFLASPVAS